MEEEIILETNSGLIVIKAILHLLDYAHGQAIRSDAVLNLDDPFLESYVLRQIRRMHHSTVIAKGTFLETGRVEKMIRGYFQKQISFEELSWNLLDDVKAYGKEHALSYDALVVDYQQDGVPYLGVVLLEEQTALLHHTEQMEKGICNTLRTGLTMPAVNKRLSLFAYVNLLNMEIRLADNEDEVVSRLLLACTKEKTGRQVLAEMEEIAREISEPENGGQGQVVAKIKQAVRTQAEKNGTVSMAKVAQEVFARQPAEQAAFLQKARRESLPEEAAIEPGEVKRWSRRQKLVTDTGIEIAFPTEYFQKTDLLEFVHHPDGTISIAIKRVGQISSKH